MFRRIAFTSLLLAVSAPAQAHFLFVVPAADGQKAQVILSEDLKPDENVGGSVVDPATLFARNGAGNDTPLTLDKAEEVRLVTLTADNPCVLYGTCELGVNQRGDSKPFLLVYHPKTILKDAFNAKANLGDAAPVELIPIGKPGDVKFQLTAKGKPVAGAEVTIILPDGEQEKVTTDDSGETSAFDKLGRYGLWARHFETVAGKHDGKSYEEVRRYPTLVVDITGTADKADKQDAAAKEIPQPARLAPLPEAASSFGAVACDGWLYAYGGHIARTHTYSTEAVSGQFHRLNLADGKTWEKLASGPGLQGMNLATHGGKIYRIGGMQPRNKPGDEADMRSTAECASFDPATKTWTQIPSLPEPRSSHDVAVVGDNLFVIGGWNMEGAEGDDWLDKMLVMDLKAENPQWQVLDQPFERRALIVAVHKDKIYVIGGFNENEEPILRVEIYDPASNSWSQGPELPGKEINGFAPAACTLNDRLYASVADGRLYRLNEENQSWEEIARTTPRIVHRLIPDGSRILVVGGANKGKNFDLIEVVDLQELPTGQPPRQARRQKTD